MDLKTTVLFKVIVLKIACAFSSTVKDVDYNLMPQLFEFDDYDKCLYRSIDAEAAYCLVKVELLPKYLNKSNVAWNLIEEVSSDRRNYRHDLLTHGVCTSGKCQKYNETKRQCLNRVYNARYKHLGLENQINELRCERKESDRVMGITDLVVMTVLGIYGVFVVLASAWTITLRSRSNITESKTDKKHENFATAFSLYDNMHSMLTTNAPNQSKTHMHFIQGLRSFNSVTIVIFHSIFSNLCIAVSDPKRIEELVSWSFGFAFMHFVLRAAVQTFLVISSWLMTINFYEKLKRQNYVSLGDVIRTIIKRYIRFTSAQAVLIALHKSLLIHIFTGPFWEQAMGNQSKECDEKWWTNLLYISNFFYDGGSCLVHTWHLSVDFQFIVLGSLILWLTQKNPKLLFLVSGLLVSFQIIFTSFYLRFNNFGYCKLYTPESIYEMKFLFTKEFQATWTSTTSNLSGLASGLCLGYVYTQHKDKRNTGTKNNNQFLWLVSTLTLTFGTMLFSSYYRTTSYYSSNRWFTAVYGGIEKPLCYFGIALFIYGLSQGRGGFVKKVLEWSPMHAMGQFSFGLYLIHMTFLILEGGIRRTPVFTSFYFAATDAMKILSISYLGSIILTLFVLMPAENVCRRIL